MTKHSQKLMGTIILTTIFMLPVRADENTTSVQNEAQKKREFTLKSAKGKIKSVKNKIMKKKNLKEEAPPIDAFTPSQMQCIGKTLEKHTALAYTGNVEMFKNEHKQCMANEFPAEESKPLPESFFNNFRDKLHCLDEIVSWSQLQLTPEEAIEEYNKKCRK